MATLMPGRTSRRPGYTKKSFITLVRHGQIYAQAWPRPRGLPKLPYQRANLERLRTAMRAVKMTPSREFSTMEQGLKKYLREHEGVRGTAAIRLRDWQTAIMYGRGFAFRHPDGFIMNTATVTGDASDLIDNMEPRPGSLITRTDVEWLCTHGNKPGGVLSLMNDGEQSFASPPASIPPKDQAVGGF